MADTASNAVQKEKEADLGKRELTPAERKKREESHEQAPPTPEATPAIGSVNAAYAEGFPNWSDPPELVDGEIEVEGSVAQPKREDWEKEQKEIRDEERERVAKAIEENNQKAEDLAAYDKEQKRKVVT